MNWSGPVESHQDGQGLVHVTEKSVIELGLLSLKGRLGLIQGKKFPDEDTQAVEQAAQWGCAGSLFGSFGDPTGENPELHGQIPEVALPGAGIWTGDLLSCHLTRVILQEAQVLLQLEVHGYVLFSLRRNLKTKFICSFQFLAYNI